MLQLDQLNPDGRLWVFFCDRPPHFLLLRKAPDVCSCFGRVFAAWLCHRKRCRLECHPTVAETHGTAGFLSTSAVQETELNVALVLTFFSKSKSSCKATTLIHTLDTTGPSMIVLLAMHRLTAAQN